MNDSPASLKPYYKRFLWLYPCIMVLVVISSIFLANMGINPSQMLMNALALTTTSMMVQEKFIADKKRFFDKAELKKIIFGTSLIAYGIQLILFTALFMLFLFVKDSGNNLSVTNSNDFQVYNFFLQHPVLFPVIIVGMFIFIFLIQTFCFRMNGRRYNKRILKKTALKNSVS